MSLSEAQRTGIEAVAMDLWEPYIHSARAHIPGAEAKLVVDRYHIMAHRGKAVDPVRKQEHRALGAAGDGTLAGSKYLWLSAGENLPEKHHERVATRKALTLKTGRAWAIKESRRELWAHATPQQAASCWARGF